jgi:hypothetical protein
VTGAEGSLPGVRAKAPLVSRVLAWMLALIALLPGCASRRSSSERPVISPAEARASINRLLPKPLPDRAGWVADIYESFTVLDIDPTPENVCAVIAVTEQESGFHVNPVVPGLGVIAWREIDDRARSAGVPTSLVHGVLQMKSSDGRTYGDRIDHAKTEQELSDIFEDLTGTVPMGRTLFERWNPIRTRGPMQVNVVFAEQFVKVRPYPYPLHGSLTDELFTRRGSLYFGIAHLLAYPAPYDSYLYRFGDFNAGQYASRNAAFQNALTVASGIALDRDGALLPHDRSAKGAGDTELAARSLAGRLRLTEEEIHGALEQARSETFEHTDLYVRVFALAERMRGRPLPRALVPSIRLHGPKLVRKLTTEWYAKRVDGRFERCLR